MMKGYIKATQQLTGRLSKSSGSGGGIQTAENTLKVSAKEISVEQANYDVAYEQLEYLENESTYCINTGYCPTNSTKIEIAFAKANVTTGFVFGSRTGSTSSDALAYMVNNVNGLVYAMFGNTQTSNKITTTLDTKHIVVISQNGAYIDNTLLKTYTEQSFESIHEIYLFACSNNTTLDSRRFIGKIYSFKVWENDVLVMDLQPCERMIDGIRGMKDSISGNFFKFEEE